MSRIPIACTLSADAVVDRLEEWRGVFSAVVEKVDRHDNRATLTLLRRRPQSLETVADLAEREKVCCSFFEFSIEVEGIESRLHIEVPAEANQILTELLSLLPEDLQPQ